MKKTILAIAVILMMAAVGIAAAEGVDVGGTVSNDAPAVTEIVHNAEYLDDGVTIPIHSDTGATFTVTAFVTDANGVDTLTSVYCTVEDPSGTIVDEGEMGVEYDDDTSTKRNLLVTVPETSPAGVYTITVIATDDGLLFHESSITETFAVTEIEKFTIAPLSLNLQSGTTVPGLFTVTMNYGEHGEVFTVDSVTFTDLTITGISTTDTIPFGNIHPLGLPMLAGVGVGESAIVELEVDVPQATTNGDITAGTGTLVITTHPPAI